MKKRTVLFEEVLSKGLEDESLKIIYDQRRFYLQVARLISELRIKSDLTQSALANLAGVSQPMVARLERGDMNRTPTFETLDKILKPLGYSLLVQVQKTKKNRAA